MTKPTETLEEIANRIAPNGARAAQMKVAKARAKLAVQAATAPTREQQAALSAYIAAREERDGLRDDLTWGDVAAQNAAVAQLAAANTALGQAINDARRLGVLEIGRRMFR